MLMADFHTHTSYCDGEHTPREMVEAAFQMGLTDYGVSGHAYFPFCKGIGMPDPVFQRYKEELYELKEEYTGRMNIHIGIELDCLGPVQKADYAIGSAHCLFKNGEYVLIDHSEAELKDAVERLWNGDWYALVKDYYELAAAIYEKTGCDWIGHFDLVTKYNQDYRYFDETKEEYLLPALRAMERLNSAGIPFEINTGAMSRGYRKEPYPSKTLLKKLKDMGGRIIINSDSHKTSTICYQFEQAASLARECGFQNTCILKPGGGFIEKEL